MMIGIREAIVESADKAILDAAVQPVDKFEVHGVMAAASAPFYAVIDNGSNNLVTLRYRLKDVAMRAVEQGFKSGDQDVPAGSFIVSGSAYARLKGAVEPLGLTAVALMPAAPTGPDGMMSTCLAPRDVFDLGYSTQ